MGLNEFTAETQRRREELPRTRQTIRRPATITPAPSALSLFAVEFSSSASRRLGGKNEC